jgi:hypothetical protein
MVDGTGMCGGCRVKVAGQTKFACVDGPDLDGHEVDFDELMKRNTPFYRERETTDKEHVCRLTGGNAMPNMSLKKVSIRSRANIAIKFFGGYHRLYRRNGG